MEQNEFAGAIQMYTEGLEVSPVNRKLNMSLKKAQGRLKSQGQVTGIQDVLLSPAETQAREEVQHHFEAGRNAMGDKDYGSAVATFETALAIKTQDFKMTETLQTLLKEAIAQHLGTGEFAEGSSERELE